mgnify:FL=1
MRRKKENLTLILIIFVAFFTLLSYVFDQLVIRKEDSIRNKTIELRNLNYELTTLNSLSMQVEDISYSINRFLEEFFVKRNYWLKNFLLLYRYDLNKVEFKKNYRDSGNDITNWVKYQMIKRFDDAESKSYSIYFDLTQLVINYPKYFDKWIEEYEKDDQNNYLESFTDYKKIFKKNLNIFSKKDFDFYYSLLDYEPDQMPDLLSSEWIDLTNFTTLILSNLNQNEQELRDKINLFDDQSEELSNLVEKKTQGIKKESSLKNYFILLSIICQILSLLFLLLLFKNILKNLKVIRPVNTV